jgi:predicted ATPase/DNA-binding CsgD family transcriptional regulator
MTQQGKRRLVAQSNTSGLTRLVGRKNERSIVRQYLLEADRRLVTLTGPGGIGKTSLAQQVGVDLQDTFADGIFFVPLDLIKDPALVIPTIAQILEVRGGEEIEERAIPELLSAFLQKKQILLLLDNFEQVIGAAPNIATLLFRCPTLKLLVTSRAALHIEEEQEFQVPPLAVPDPARLPEWETFVHYAAVELFLQRAQARRSGFTLTSHNAHPIAAMCAYLNGNPMAIKLATTYINVLSPQALLLQLKKDPLGTLTDDSRDIPVRHQTLSNTLRWSYGLLEPGERLLFRRLSLFVGGCTLEALEKICLLGGDEAGHILVGVASLIDKSLVQRDERGEEPYFVMLPIIREYALALLKEEREEEKTRQAHAQYYLEWAETAAPKFRSSEQEHWFQRLEQDYENVRAAFEWLLAQKKSVLASRLANALWWYWLARGHFSEGRRWLEHALSHSDEEMGAVHAELLSSLGMLTLMQGDILQTEIFFARSFVSAQNTSNTVAIASSLQGRGMVAWVKNDFAEGRAHVEQALELWNQLDEHEGLAWSLSTLALILAKQREYARASASAEESLRLFRAYGDSFGLAYGLLRAAEVAFLQDHAAASEQEPGKREAKRENEEKMLAKGLPAQKRAGSGKKGRSSADTLLQEGLAIFQHLGNRWGIAQAFSTSGRMVAAQGDQSEAYRFYKQTLELALETYEKARIVSFLDIASCLEGLAYVVGSQRDHHLAAQCLGMAELLRQTIGVSLPTDSHLLYQETVATARHHLGGEVFADAWDQGRAMQPEHVPDLLLIHEDHRHQETQTKPVVHPDGLTSREVEILCLIAQGFKDPQVAKALVISPRTVNAHLTRIYRKLDIDSRSAATRYVIEHHLDVRASLHTES